MNLFVSAFLLTFCLYGGATILPIIAGMVMDKIDSECHGLG